MGCCSEIGGYRKLLGFRKPSGNIPDILRGESYHTEYAKNILDKAYSNKTLFLTRIEFVCDVCMAQALKNIPPSTQKYHFGYFYYFVCCVCLYVDGSGFFGVKIISF